MSRQRTCCIAMLFCASVHAPVWAGALFPVFGDSFELIEPATLAGITAQHNSVRSGIVTVPALPPMNWNANLAATAQAWANQCVDVQAPQGLIDHNPGRSVGHPFYVGENIYGSGSLSSVGSVVGLWASEAANYNYAANTCSGMCGHYTQIVWRTSLFVGCARSDCPGHTFRHAVICNYGPGGNSGGRPY